jgi:Lrp/AsnC family leucine-responsive transcriptional regulator
MFDHSMTGNKPDGFDLKILALLKERGRIGMGKLSNIVGLRHSAATRRIEKMEKAALIKKYVTVVDRQKTGHPVLILLLLKLKDPNPELFNKFEEKITAMTEIQACYLVSGTWNYIIHVIASTPQSYAYGCMSTFWSRHYWYKINQI